MTTATGEYTSISTRLAAISIAAKHNQDGAPGVSSSWPSPSLEEISGKDNGEGPQEIAAGEASSPGKSWKSPARRPPVQGEVIFMEEPRSSWPVPSCDGASKKMQPQGLRQEAALARTPSAEEITVAGSSSSPESAFNGDHVMRSLAINLPVDLQEKQHEGSGTSGEERRASDLAVVSSPHEDLPLPMTNVPRAAHPPLLPAPRQQRERPPARNARRGRNHQHFPHHSNNGGDYNNSDNSRNHQQQRPRHPSKTSFPPHQQPNQVVNSSFYHPMDQSMMGIPSLAPDWFLNTVPNAQWGTTPLPSTSYFISPAPSPESMFLYGYLPGPHYAEGFPYSAPPFSPIMPPPPVWNQPYFVNPLPPTGKAAFQDQPPYQPLAPDLHQPLAPDLHQPPADITGQDIQGVDARLRKQIEYYFSDENLMKDGYLKKCMDSQGWISVHTIAKFPRVQVLTGDVELIMEAMQTSATVEVSVNKMRRRGEWSKWVLRQGPTLEDQ